MGCMFSSNFSCQPYVINIQVHNTDNISTDLYILLKPQSQLGYLGFNGEYLRRPDNVLSPSRADASSWYGCIKPLINHFFNHYFVVKQYATARACGARNYQTFLGRLWGY